MRIEGRGLLDRSQRVGFSFDGRRLEGFQGDTLASALLAGGVRVVGRSFKYHRPRGIWSAGPEEPNALVTVGRGAQREPNRRATTIELRDGLQVASQNRWPMLTADLMAVNDLAAPFLAAGFYYKTFMWPRAFWERVYEPMIRRAAGLGKLSLRPDPDTQETAWAFCDLLVIGGGPAGLMAAREAARAGADVILADEDFSLGGRLLAEIEEVGGQAGHAWARATEAELRQMPNVRLMRRTSVMGAYDGGVYGAFERVSDHRERWPNLPRSCFWRIVARRAVLAAGALERGIAFPDNDRPGVMQAGAVRAYLNRWGVAPGRAVAVFGSNDGARRTARDLAAAGIRVTGLFDTRPDQPASSDFPVHSEARVLGTSGRLGLRTITVAHGAVRRAVHADCLAVAGGWNPSVHIACHMGGRPDWREDILSFVARPGAVPGLEAAGAANGAFSTAACLREGAEAGRRAAGDLGFQANGAEVPEAEDGWDRPSPFWVVEGRGRKWLDLQNDVTVKDVRLAAQENYASAEHMKRYTTQGMATDQGKTSNVLALAILADATGRTIPETGTTTFRPPYMPVPIGAMGADGREQRFAPRRLTTSDTASRERGAPMIEAGLWYRPSYFPRAGETTWRESCDREVTMVREAVGVTDVSTLGKIDVQGPDAARFLDFVYAGTMSTLAPGRARYGLMLREDGHVMDDGTCARLSEGHFVVTTTTAAAGLVMRHMDHAAQVLRPELDVQLVSVTEAWAQFAVAGPRSEELVAALLDGAAPELPFMGHAEVSVMGVPGRLFRISFSGERGYEVAVPAGHGEALWRILLAQAEARGGGAYGMEALNVLRIEKGFLTHAELHGRTTAYDLGLERMVSKAKDCIGLAASRRDGLLDAERERLVGLWPVEPAGVLTAGAHLFAGEDASVRENDQGYLTSVAHSPTLGHMIGLGFVARGPERMGEVLRMVDHLRGIETLVEVTSPVFYDPEGGRMRG